MLLRMIPMRQAGLAALILCILTNGGVAYAKAQEPTALGTFDDWTAYTYKNAAGTVCYVVSKPKGSEPKNIKRDPAFFLVTHRPAQKVRNEVSTIIGYPFKENTTVSLTVDKSAFELFTNGDGAWADTAAKDKQIVTAMLKGQKLSVKGTSRRGTQTTDTYSLSGIKAALAKIDEICK
jgi:invasion protein IalB